MTYPVHINPLTVILPFSSGKQNRQSHDVCEGFAEPISCDSDTHALRVLSAYYGFINNDKCLTDQTSNSTCGATNDVVSTLRRVCEGRQECWIVARNLVFGDPCPGLYKMANVQYQCQRTSETSRKTDLSVCEFTTSKTIDRLLQRSRGQRVRAQSWNGSLRFRSRVDVRQLLQDVQRLLHCW